MSEYIDRNEAYDAVLFATCGTGCQYEATYAIDRIPEADVAPVVHGHWTEKKPSGGGGIWDYYFVCSVCGGNTPNKAYVIAPNFCPDCGAKMDGGD